MKYEELRERCVSEVSVLPVGSTVPSVRALMRHFRVSQATVTKVLQHLKQLGLIESRVGVGTLRVAPSAEPRVRTLRIGLVISDYHSAFTDSLRRTCQSYFTARNHAFECHCVADAKLLSGKFNFNSCYDAWMVNMNKDFTHQLIEQLATLTKPVVCLDIMPGGLKLDAVCADNHFGGAMVAEFFFQRGHTRIGLLHGSPDSHCTGMRNTGFFRQLELNGREGVRVECHTRDGENCVNSSYQAFQAHIRAHGLNFSALFCDNDLVALGVFRACHELGIHIPGQLEVIGFDNIPEGGYLNPALSSVDQNLPEWVAAADRIIQDRLNGRQGEAVQCLINPKLVLRESVKSGSVPAWKGVISA